MIELRRVDRVALDIGDTLLTLSQTLAVALKFRWEVAVRGKGAFLLSCYSLARQCHLAVVQD